MAKNYRSMKVPENYHNSIKNYCTERKYTSMSNIMSEMARDEKKLKRFIDNIMRSNKKGIGFVDLGLMLLIILILFVSFAVAIYFMDVVNTEIQNFGNDTIPQESLNAVAQLNSNFAPTLDYILVAGLFIILAGLFLSMWLLDNLPGIFVFFFIMTIIFVFISLPLINMIYDTTQDSFMGLYFAQMPYFTFFVNNWILVITVFVAALIVGYAAKPDQGGTL